MGKDNDPRRGWLTPDRIKTLLNGASVSIPGTQGGEIISYKPDFIATMIEEIPSVISATRVRARGERPLRCYMVATEEIQRVQVKLAQNPKDRDAELGNLLKNVPEERRSAWLKENAIIVAFRPKDREDAKFKTVLESRLQAIQTYHKRIHKT